MRHELLLYAAFSYWCMRPSATSLLGLKVVVAVTGVEAAVIPVSLSILYQPLSVSGLKLVHEA